MGAFGPPRLEERPILVAGVHFLARGGFNAIRAGEADSAATDASVPITVSVGVPTTLVWALLVAARLSGIPSIACTYASHLVAGPPATAVVHTIFLVAVRSQMPSVALTGPFGITDSVTSTRRRISSYETRTQSAHLCAEAFLLLARIAVELSSTKALTNLQVTGSVATARSTTARAAQELGAVFPCGVVLTCALASGLIAAAHF